ncbi:MAG: preprotein translocase subunit SecE [Clostridia bacterium]|nr:preprotein translocase subunit SecE [Clostridia bacterium]MBQ8850747.1 preprotein translocase subunit SecE [Clostridia bacterium]
MSDKEKKVAETKAETKKPAKEKKKGKLKEAWKGFNSERKKIVWPTWKQVLKNTLVVLVVVGSCAVVIAALDITFHEGIKALPELINKIKG